MYGSRISVDVVDGGVTHAIVGAAPQRYSLTIYPPAVGSVTISNEPIPAGGNGIVLIPQSRPYYVCREDHGDIATRAHYIAYAGGASSVGFIEVLD